MNVWHWSPIFRYHDRDLNINFTFQLQVNIGSSNLEHINFTSRLWVTQPSWVTDYSLHLNFAILDRCWRQMLVTSWEFITMKELPTIGTTNITILLPTSGNCYHHTGRTISTLVHGSFICVKLVSIKQGGGLILTNAKINDPWVFWNYVCWIR